ncbi:hypothetical protein RHMOL_Rhmol04G0102800 [Rhododendron molle]|uniref:Uncharacterized protein n=1 Tax=Rhododendron molle TaxID=49168 RepID=A0ACC0P015_RHOML|nr:hypothetical protein RHMOL_Rhmol04G0102800 [Rhododendron molle]
MADGTRSQEVSNSIHNDLVQINAVLSNMLEIIWSRKENLQYLEEILQCRNLLVGEMSSGKAEMEKALANADIKGELPLAFEKATKLESDDSPGTEEDSDICPMSANHSALVSTSYQSPSRSRPSFKVTSNPNRMFQSVAGTKSISIRTMRVTGREKEMQGGEAPNTPTIRLIVIEWDPGGIFFQLKLSFFGYNNPPSFSSGVLILQSATRVKRGMSMYDEFGPWDCACKVFDKIIGPNRVAQMVITFVKVNGVKIVGIVIDKMPHKDPTGWNVTIEGYAQYVQLRNTLCWCHKRVVDRNEITCGNGSEVDDCYEQNGDNSLIFSREIQPLISRVFDDQNVGIIAVGAKGSGKTYTIPATEEKQGLLALAFAEVLSMAGDNQKCSSRRATKQVPYEQLREALYLYHLGLMEGTVGTWMVCGFHKAYGINDFNWELTNPGWSMLNYDSLSTLINNFLQIATALLVTLAWDPMFPMFEKVTVAMIGQSVNAIECFKNGVFEVDELPALVKAKFCVWFHGDDYECSDYYCNVVVRMIAKASNVRHLWLHNLTLKVVIHASAYNQLLFRSLTHLDIGIRDIPCLEKIEFHGFSGCNKEMKLVRYLLENAMVLKKWTLRSWSRNKKIKTDLQKYKRGSSTCQIEFCHQFSFVKWLYPTPPGVE